MNKQELLDKQRALQSLVGRSGGVDLALAMIQQSVVGLFITMFDTIEEEVTHKLELKNRELDNANKALDFYASEDNHNNGGVMADKGARARAARK